jgi:hypothetical protein
MQIDIPYTPQEHRYFVDTFRQATEAGETRSSALFRAARSLWRQAVQAGADHACGLVEERLHAATDTGDFGAPSDMAYLIHTILAPIAPPDDASKGPTPAGIANGQNAPTYAHLTPLIEALSKLGFEVEVLDPGPVRTTPATPQRLVGVPMPDVSAEEKERVRRLARQSEDRYVRQAVQAIRNGNALADVYDALVEVHPGAAKRLFPHGKPAIRETQTAETAPSKSLDTVLDGILGNAPDLQAEFKGVLATVEKLAQDPRLQRLVHTLVTSLHVPPGPPSDEELAGETKVD